LAELKLGYKASAEQFGPRDLLEMAVVAEECGFDSVWVSDHFQPWRHTNGHSPFSLSWLGALGERTARVVLGTSVLTPTFRYHPSVIAQAFGTLACLNPGRMVLGIGTGESLNEVGPTGLEWPAYKERFGRFGEAIDLMRRLWREERVNFEGTYYRTDQATVYDRPDQPVPLFIAAAGPSAAKLAGRVGDGLICTSGKADAVYDEKILPPFREGLDVAGRPAGDVEQMIEIKVSFHRDVDQAARETRNWAALALTPEEKMGVEDPLEMERLADALPVERAASRWIVSNDPEEVADRIAPYVGRGFTHLVFHSPADDQPAFLRLYSERVLPVLRRRFG